MKADREELVKLPVKYSAAKQALAVAVRIDEVKNIRDIAVAMRVYAFQAKDGQLAEDATEIKMRATRRVGQLIEEQRKAGVLAKGARGQGRPIKGGLKKSPPKDQRSLDAQGVDKNLAHAARRAAAVPEDQFDKDIIKAKRLAKAAAEGDKGIITAARQERHETKKAKRQQREQLLAQKLQALPVKKYAVILADPEWKWKAWSEKGLDGTSADNHYPTSILEVIKSRDVPSIAADDCVLFLWATVPMMPQGLDVLEAWGFNYVSHFAWEKDKAGTGYWNRNKHELLLIGTKGKIPAPVEGTQWESVIVAPRGKHSEKPDCVYEMIEAYFPNLPKIELNARKHRLNWDAWGLEAPESEAAE